MASEDLNRLTLPDVFDRLAATGLVDGLLALVREEDLGPDRVDLTSEISFGARDTMRAELRAREPGVLSGLAAAPNIVCAYDAVLAVEAVVRDGERVEPGQVVASLEGNARDMLAIERPLLNLVSRLSGVATRTAAFVSALGVEWPAKLYDTRKTTPGLRVLEKYAVRCGGGNCHRLGLHDAIMFKDNHIAALGEGPWTSRVQEAVSRARERWPRRYSFVEVEVDGIEQFVALLSIPEGVIDLVLLDNMSPSNMREACRMKCDRHPEWELEASGGVTLDSIALVASSMVDRISVGSLTHHAVSLDFGLDVV